MTVDESGLGPQHFDVAVDWRGDTVVVTVSGELDLVTAPQLQESVTLVLGKSPTALVIDLSDVGFLASAGMSLLASTHQQLGEEAKFAVVADGPATGRPLSLVGLDQLFGIYATVEEALTALATGKS
ncbi:STAS domain-containing protein [Rhodococcoides kyotonense]|uniref:STAS domain-containing protein n=1 Tax=Rhodococcoides kyotonense TaxID=398843 RepID=UPI002481A8C4|nr:STAS domain-containing protein [Rhodococcus kyotonensis]